MTEEEAKTKWCPMAREPGYTFEGSYNGTSVNRPEHGAPYPKCIASACMAWRSDITPTVGYCGLAGKP